MSAGIVADVTTAPELADLLSGLYPRCQHLEPGRACSACVLRNRPIPPIRFEPEKGHVPRGYAGATGELSAVRLIVVAAEPGDPEDGERYDADGGPRFDQVRAGVHGIMRTSREVFHRNLRTLLSLCFGGEDWDDWLRRAWVTQAVLCSIPERPTPPKGGKPKKARRHYAHVSGACWETWLWPQLDRLPRAAILAAGSKAWDAVEAYTKDCDRKWCKCRALAPPGCHHKDRPELDWDKAAAWFRAWLAERRP